MKKRTNEELIQILTVSKNDYLPEALLAAEAEFESRNLNKDQVDFVTKKLVLEKEKDDRKANEPLDPVYKVLTLIFPIVFTFILSGFYKSNGYDKKANELARWTFLGFALYLILIILFIVL